MKIVRENLCSLLHDMPQYNHRQSWPQWLQHPAVSLQSLRGAPGTRGKGPAIEAKRKAIILRAVEVERLSLRAAEHVFGVARQTVAKWLGKKAEDLPPLSETLLPAEKGDVLELDVLWSFVGSKANARWV